MRNTSRLCAEVSKYLEAGRPTGLTGIYTHPSPRAALLHKYHTTLDKLSQFPSSSIYRQSTEALTKHRLSIIESVRPAGIEAWHSRIQPIIDSHPHAFKKIATQKDKKRFELVYNLPKFGVYPKETGAVERAHVEGPVEAHERIDQGEQLAKEVMPEEDNSTLFIEPEPSLTIAQVEDIENQIGAGLIEEVIAVAQAESDLVDRMYQDKVWEELEVKPTEGQWAYYERDSHSGKTQAVKQSG